MTEDCSQAVKVEKKGIGVSSQKLSKIKKNYSENAGEKLGA